MDRVHANDDGSLALSPAPTVEASPMTTGEGYTKVTASNTPRKKPGGSRNAVAQSTCILSLGYFILSTVLAGLSYQQVGPRGGLGVDSLATLERLAGAERSRGWASKEASRMAHLLKSEIGNLEEEFPDRIDTMNQHVPINNDNVHGAMGDPRCQSIALSDCILEWGRSEQSTTSSSQCATSCPYDNRTAVGPLCCGLHSQGDPATGFLYPAFWSNVVTDKARETLNEALKSDWTTPRSNGVDGPHVSNIVFRVKGKGESKPGSAILVSGHFDSEDKVVRKVGEPDPKLDPSQPSESGPGISDALAGVSILVEVARLLASQAPLERDVIFAFVSGKEAGLMGSTIFKQFHPWRDLPAFVINLEGKGKANSKEWLARSNSQYAVNAYYRFANRPAGFSLVEQMFGSTSFGYSDLSIYRRLGYHGIDLVYLHDSYVDHTPDDTLEGVSAAGLDHEGSNVLSIVQGVAGDPDFPRPLTADEDPVVGFWNNEVAKDPPMTGGSVYVSMYDAWLWIMTEFTTKIVFGLAVVVAVASTIALIVFWHQASLLPADFPIVQVVLGIFVDALVFALSLGLGTLLAGVGAWVLKIRDLRTWYSMNILRMAFLGCLAALPMAGIEARRRREFGIDFFDKLLRIDAASHDITVLVGGLLANSTILLILTKHLPHLGFTLFWQVLLFPAGLGLETAVLATSKAPKRPKPEVDETELLDGEDPEGASYQESLPTPREEAIDSREVFPAIAGRELFTVCLPLLLALPQLYNLNSVLMYLLDSQGREFEVGTLVGSTGVLMTWCLAPGLRRLSKPFAEASFLGLAVLTAAWLVLCFLVPTDTERFCYATLSC